jgi:hypothetical protein
MSSQSKELCKNDELVNVLSRMIPVFKQFYEASHGDASINGIPRRVQLSSLVLRLLFQNAELTKEISAAFFSDTEIRNFFGITANVDTDSGEVLFGGNRCVLDNSGSGGTQQPISAIANLFLAAIDLCVLEKDELDETTIVANLHKMIADFKAFVMGSQIEETHLIGFSGFITEEGTRIGFGDLNAFPLSAFQSAYFFGRGDGIGFVVKETFCRKKLFAGTSEQMHEFIGNGSMLVDEEFFTNMHLLIKNVRLALVLTLSDEKNAFPSFIEGDYLMTPTGNMNSFVQRDVVVGRRPVNLQLNQKSVNQLSIKYLSIVDADLSSIEIAIKRLLSAVCTRDNDDDALIDAVMCWENIIGSESEVTFRICASIAKLLAKNNTERADVYKKLKKIYGTRSSLVHGNSDYKTDSDITRQAIFYAVGLLNAILGDNELLQMTSAKRSEYIMLNMGAS